MRHVHECVGETLRKAHGEGERVQDNAPHMVGGLIVLIKDIPQHTDFRILQELQDTSLKT